MSQCAYIPTPKPTDLDGQHLLLHRVLDREAEDLHVTALAQAVHAVDGLKGRDWRGTGLRERSTVCGRTTRSQ
jgi:hypothetical protein